jgi:hypothetical protein
MASAAPAPPLAPEAVASAATPAPAAGASLAGFEGEVEVRLWSKHNATAEQTLRLQVKGDRLRMEVPAGTKGMEEMGGAPRVVFDVKAQKMTAIVDERKMAITMDVARFAEQAKAITGSSPSAAPQAQPTLTRSGKMDTVAGHSCEEWNVVSPTGEKSLVCVATEAAPYIAFPAASLPPEQAWAREVFDGKHLPLRFVGHDRTGAVETRIQVEKIDKRPIDEALFAIPAGYQVMDMAQMTQAMMAGMPSALSPGIAPPAGGVALPPGLGLPPGMQLPAGVKLPPETQKMLKELQERARKAAAPQQK